MQCTRSRCPGVSPGRTVTAASPGAVESPQRRSYNPTALEALGRLGKFARPLDSVEQKLEVGAARSLVRLRRGLGACERGEAGNAGGGRVSLVLLGWCCLDDGGELGLRAAAGVARRRSGRRPCYCRLRLLHPMLGFQLQLAVPPEIVVFVELLQRGRGRAAC